MLDLLERRGSILKVPTVLEAIKERLVEYRFNIDLYDIKEGTLKGRRNTLDKMVLGLYRKVKVDIDRKDEKKEADISISIRWGGLFFANLLTFVFTFLIAYAVMKEQGMIALLYSIPVGFLFVLLNLALFTIMRTRILMRIKQDLKDLEKEERRRKRSGK
jgi:hypothetical protein